MIISFFISLIISVSLFFITGSFASTAFAILIIIIGTLSSFLLKKEYRQNGLKLFYIVFSVYTFFALFHYLDVYYFNNFIFPDEFGSFLPWAQSLSQNKSLISVFNDAYDRSVLIGNRGYIFYIGAVSYIAHNYLGGFNELVLFLSSVLFGSLSALAIYRLLLFNADKKRSFRYALLYSLFSASLLFSFVLLRDIHISFFFLCGFIIVSKKHSLKGLLLLILLNILVWNFRYHHGFFFIILLLYYIYIKYRKQKVIFITIGIIAILFLSTFLYENYSRVSRSMEGYAEFTEERILEKDDSIGKIFWKLPTPLKEVGIVLNSQLQPFPSWNALANSKNLYAGIIALPSILYSFFWFTVIFSLLKWFVIKRKYKLISKELRLLSLIALFLIIANVSNPNLRRIMCVYPILYLIYVIINTKLISRRQVNYTVFQSTVTYIGLVAVYLIVKFV